MKTLEKSVGKEFHNRAEKKLCLRSCREPIKWLGEYIAVMINAKTMPSKRRCKVFMVLQEVYNLTL